MNLVQGITQKMNEFNKHIEQRDIIQEMDDHLMNLHESDEEEDTQQQYQMQHDYDSKSVAKFVTLWLKLSSRKEEQTYQAKRCYYFYIWKYYQQSNIFEVNWKKEENSLVQQKRYPFHKMKKQRQKIEEQIFDLERKNFFQIRQKTILVQVFKNAARRERLIKTIAFHRLIRNIALITYNSNYNTNSNVFKQSGVGTTSQQNNAVLQKENKVNKSRSKSPISTSNSRIQLQPSKQQALKYRGASKLIMILLRREQQQQLNKSIYFMRWYQFMSKVRQLEQIEEINSINIILNENVFRQNVFRTKISLQKQEIDSKVQLATQLLMQLLK